MLTTIRLGVTWLVMTASTVFASDATLSGVSLADAVSAAEQQHTGAMRAAGDTPYQSSAWLAALPSIAISYLASDENEGTDETELSLNLPIKSAAGRKYDQELRLLAQQIQDNEAQRRRLYLSGLVREALWSHRIAQTRSQFSDKKIALLKELLQRQQALFEARSASRYSLLLIQQELTDAQLDLQTFRWEAERWQRRFADLTGLSTPPEDISEAKLLDNPDYSQHPRLRLLDLGWRRQQALIAAGSEGTTPWTVSLTARQLNTPQFGENQYGMALDIPLSVFDISTESSRSEWREAARSYWQSRDELQLALLQRREFLAGEAAHLHKQQALLEASANISGQLLAETRSLISENELAYEIWVRRALNDIDKRAESAINTLRAGQNLAMTRQALGLPL